MKTLQGTGVALITPFKSDYSIDFDALKRIVNHVINGGVEYLVVLGTTAETATLTETEKNEIIQAIITENNGRLPLVLGVGGNNTSKVVEEICQLLQPFFRFLRIITSLRKKEFTSILKP